MLHSFCLYSSPAFRTRDSFLPTFLREPTFPHVAIAVRSHLNHTSLLPLGTVHSGFWPNHIQLLITHRTGISFVKLSSAIFTLCFVVYDPLHIGQVGLLAFFTCSSMQIWHPEWTHFKLTGFNIVTKLKCNKTVIVLKAVIGVVWERFQGGFNSVKTHQRQHCNLLSTEPVRTQLKATADADCDIIWQSIYVRLYSWSNKAV